MNIKPMMQKRHLLFFLLFFGGLLFSYWLPNRFYLFEPYPAILMPSGHGKFEVPQSGNIYFKKRSIIGLKKDGLRNIEIPISDFLYPIPPHIALHVLKKDFGLHPKPIKVILGEINTIFWIKPKASPQDIIDTKLWLRQRLNDIGCVDTFLFIQDVLLEFNIEKQSKVGEKVIDAKRILLTHESN
jgi:hypothetical protein